MSQPPTIASSTSPRLLHLGCGLIAPAEWVNVDGSLNAKLAKRPRLRRLLGQFRLIPRSFTEIPWPENIQVVDLRRTLPFAEGSFDAAFSSHLLEHIFRGEALRLLKEVYRVLTPGGYCRSLVPDLAAVIREYQGDQSIQLFDVPENVQNDPARRMCHRLGMYGEEPERVNPVMRIYRALKDFHSHKWMYDGPSLVQLMCEAGFNNCGVRDLHQSQIPHIDKVEMPGRVLHGVGVIVEGRKPN
jgi:SAM-dependent methyltransferase